MYLEKQIKCQSLTRSGKLFPCSIMHCSEKNIINSIFTVILPLSGSCFSLSYFSGVCGEKSSPMSKQVRHHDCFLLEAVLWAGQQDENHWVFFWWIEIHTLFCTLLNSGLTTESKVSPKELCHQCACSIVMSLAATETPWEDQWRICLKFPGTEYLFASLHLHL